MYVSSILPKTVSFNSIEYNGQWEWVGMATKTIRSLPSSDTIVGEVNKSWFIIKVIVVIKMEWEYRCQRPPFKLFD